MNYTAEQARQALGRVLRPAECRRGIGFAKGKPHLTKLTKYGVKWLCEQRIEYHGFWNSAKRAQVQSSRIMAIGATPIEAWEACMSKMREFHVLPHWHPLNQL